MLNTALSTSVKVELVLLKEFILDEVNRMTWYDFDELVESEGRNMMVITAVDKFECQWMYILI